MPSAGVPVDRLQGEGEDQHQFSALAASLWEKWKDMCLLKKNALLRRRNMKGLVSGKAEMPSSGVRVDRFHGEGENQQ